MRRRQFLAATAGIGLTPVAAGRSRPQSSSSSAPLGTLELPGLAETVVGDDGTTAFAAVSDGFATVDLSDPTAPVLLAERRDILAGRADGPLRNVWDVKCDGDTLAVVGPANPRRDAIEAAVFYDVSDPADPERLGVHETPYPIHNCDIDDGVASLTANSAGSVGLATVSVGSDPERLGGWALTDHDQRWADVRYSLANLHDVYVQDGLAYLAHWDAGTWIVDVSDPATPSLVSRVRGRPVEELREYGRNGARREGLRRPGNDHYVAVNESGDLLGIGIEAWFQPGPGGIVLYDVSDVANPRRLTRIDPPPIPEEESAGYSNGVWTTAHNFTFAGDRLYTSWYQGGVKVFDVSDPANPTEIAAWRDTDDACFWTACPAGDAVVAPSVDQPPGVDITERLYTLPDPGSGLTPADGGGTPTDGATDTVSRAATTTDASGPGFGVLAGLAGLGLGAWRATRDRTE
ncbi:LVIVD repeat-containing protein [Halorientalis regularis]|uniref:Uncharacterized conserved protein n=1 Tax=Halorientalis regularis TaxID=660518 RepID=A0A1G7Q1L3_9EURY|nr:hypothetical protein [Halorientalis regularis]SDF91799.1 Uncharacterized conserved protein [Halorientalis regularis]